MSNKEIISEAGYSSSGFIEELIIYLGLFQNDCFCQ